jgi:hypothetical protein
MTKAVTHSSLKGESDTADYRFCKRPHVGVASCTSSLSPSFSSCSARSPNQNQKKEKKCRNGPHQRRLQRSIRRRMTGLS